MDRIISTMQFQNQRRVAAHLKLREAETSVGLPISARRLAQRDAVLSHPARDEDPDPDPEQIIPWLVTLWP